MTNLITPLASNRITTSNIVVVNSPEATILIASCSQGHAISSSTKIVASACIVLKPARSSSSIKACHAIIGIEHRIEHRCESIRHSWDRNIWSLSRHWKGR
ncbi:hypothetical protein RchiOBHm_Chr1g0381331 [Rosa chinensis]|uniref:Uncharacterized protein n=1 Tax=Rosa chinensis TaxID=74649 RepID=A0A2P6SP42_ROSCH|nr:hypothetical protein RchiOBHm_Chr1g0381331 [Rosa chinensis]